LQPPKAAWCCNVSWNPPVRTGAKSGIRGQEFVISPHKLGGGPYRSAVAGKLGQSSAALSQLRDRLITKGLIYAIEDHDYIEFSVPRFDEFMRRYMTYRAPPKRKK